MMLTICCVANLLRYVRIICTMHIMHLFVLYADYAKK